MKIIINEKKVRRYRKIGSGFLYATFALLAIGLVLTFNQDLSQNITPYFLALFLALLASQVGIYFTNHYGGNPRQDHALNAALKGLDDRYKLYHFNAGTNHLLVGPAGIQIILPYFQGGTFTYDENKKRWKQSRASTFMKIFGREGLGRPDLDIKDNIENTEKFLTKKLGNSPALPVEAILVFTNPEADVQALNAPTPTVRSDKLKDFIRRKTKEVNVPENATDPIIASLPKEEDFEA